MVREQILASLLLTVSHTNVVSLAPMANIWSTAWCLVADEKGKQKHVLSWVFFRSQWRETRQHCYLYIYLFFFFLMCLWKVILKYLLVQSFWVTPLTVADLGLWQAAERVCLPCISWDVRNGIYLICSTVWGTNTFSFLILKAKEEFGRGRKMGEVGVKWSYPLGLEVMGFPLRSDLIITWCIEMNSYWKPF